MVDQQSSIKISINQILNSTQESAIKAVDFIGDGRAMKDSDRLNPADIWLITTPDDAIQEVCKALA